LAEPLRRLNIVFDGKPDLFAAHIWIAMISIISRGTSAKPKRSKGFNRQPGSLARSKLDRARWASTLFMCQRAGWRFTQAYPWKHHRRQQTKRAFILAQRTKRSMASAHDKDASTHITLLGGFTLRVGDGEPMALPLRAKALVALLLLREGRPTNREVIREWLWPGRGEKQGRNSLKQDLYILRRDGFAGRDVIVSMDDGLSLRPGHLACDLFKLRRLISEGTVTHWQAITGLYTEPLLDRFPPISPEFDNFLAGMRAALEADILKALDLLADEASGAGDLEQYAIITERTLAIDPLREETHRRLIQAYASAGRRVDAVRVYNDAKARLREELDVAPALETEALMRRIIGRQSDDSARSVSQSAAATTPIYRGPPRIAVLPLRQFLDKPLPSHHSDGFVSDVIDQLAGLRDLTVIAHGSTLGLRDHVIDLPAIGRKLGARYLVVCNLHLAAGRLRLTTELAEAESGAIITPFNHDVDPTSFHENQDQVVARLVNKLAPQVREAELRRIRGKRPTVLSAYDKVLLSREHITMLDRSGFDEAKTLLSEVMQEDPGYAEAYALAAEWHGAMVGERWSTDRAADIAAVERLTRIALNLDGCNIRALVACGHRRSVSYRDHYGAMRMFDQALDVAPCSANAWAMSSYCYAFSGNAQEAVRRATRALELSPHDREAGKFYNALCVAHYTAENYELAAEWGHRALTEMSSWHGTGVYTAISLAALGRLREAREIAVQTMDRLPGQWQVEAMMSNHPYKDDDRRLRTAQHLLAAGFPD
jgi:DNA-binding SARP family transcriptional activator